jgi:hypothetical protein
MIPDLSTAFSSKPTHDYRHQFVDCFLPIWYMSKNVFIVVLNWNGADDTLTCLNSLQELHYQDCRLVVVDNGSTDGSLERIRTTIWARTVTILENGTNLGYAGGNNVGIRYALEQDAAFILLLNNDTVVDPQLIDALIHAAERYPDDGIFGATIFYLERPDTVWFQGAKWLPDALDFTWPGQGLSPGVSALADEETDYVCGAAMFFRAEIARKIGVLDERFFLVFEESDWCFRARRASYGCRMVSAAKVWHKIGASFGTETSPLRAYFSSRNKLLWSEKNLSWRLRLQVWKRILTSLSPSFRVRNDPRVPLAKRLVWAIRQYCSDWGKFLTNPRQRTVRRGVLDYVLRRFGDCPEKVREISRRWSDTNVRDTSHRKSISSTR